MMDPILKKLLRCVIAATGSLMLSQVSLAAENEHLVMTCNACHGQNSVAQNNAWPNLAGQKQGYLALQLSAFKDGSRKNPLMDNVISTLSEQDIQELARYYADLPFSKPAAADLNAAGQNVRANCISCHGMNGQTVNDTWPNLAGQNQDYLYQQLLSFSNKSRDSIIMHEVTKVLTDAQMKDVAEYYQQIAVEH
jgi:cytochrome c553